MDSGTAMRKTSRGMQWECPQCHKPNSPSQKVCEHCQYPEIVENASEGSMVYSETNRKPGWGCPTCTFFNKSNTNECEICEAPKPEFPVSTAENMKVVKKDLPDWTCPRCAFVNLGVFELCKMCQFDPMIAKEHEGDISVSPSSALEPDLSTEPNVGDIKSMTPEKLIEIVDMSILGSWVLDTHVLFKVWSPNAQKIFVAGDFNKWKESDTKFELATHPKDPSIFYGIFNNINVSASYKYHILTKEEKWLWRADPRSLTLIPGRYNLNSKVYDPTTFIWCPDYVAPKWNEMIFYEMHIGAFTKEGTLNSAVNSFPYLKDLGVNTIALMPINQDSHDCCWGYDPSSLFAIHLPFGSPRDLQNFVNEAHKIGIAVVLDWIPNHMSPKSQLHNFDTLTEEGPYYYQDERKTTDFGPKLDYSQPHVRDYIKHSALVFLRYFNFDGIRVDSTVTMRRKFNDKEEQNVEAWTLLQDLNDMVHKHFPDRIMIAEDLQGMNKINYSLCGFDSQWDDRFFSTMYTVAIEPSDSNRNMSHITDAIGHCFNVNSFNRIIYTENHDTIPGNRQKRLPEAIIPGKGDLNLFSIKRSVLCAAILATSPGIPMILQGQEILETSSPDWPVPPTVDWSRKDKFQGIFNLYRTLFELRVNKYNNTKGLTSPNVTFPHINENNKVIAYHRFDKGGPGDDVIVIVNFSNTAFREYNIGVPRQGNWKIRFNSDLKIYSPLFDGTLLDSVESNPKPQDEFFFSISLRLGRYSMVILSMDP